MLLTSSCRNIHTRRLCLETLEDRRVLAPVLVDTHLDINDGITTDITTLEQNKGADGKISLREAILAANGTQFGDTVHFASGVGSLITLDQAFGELSITDDLTIDASMLDDGLTIDAGLGGDGVGDGNGFRIFNITGGDVTLIGLTLTGGDVSGDGGAIRTDSSLTLRNVTVSNNFASVENSDGGNGGGVFVATTNEATEVRIENSIIEDDHAFEGRGGGVFLCTTNH